jgi:HprK-related kinase A
LNRTGQRFSPAATCAELGPEAVRRRLVGPAGLVLDLGLATACVRGGNTDLAAGLCAIYRNHPIGPDGCWSDLHAHLLPGRGLRRWVGAQVRFLSDGSEPFDPFPASHALPLLEWGLNWMIARRMNDALLLHAGVLERDGLALVMPATPGSGKSTLTAALSLRGWRLLSDEFGAFDLQAQAFRAVLKPVALKNASIDVIGAFEPSAPLGPRFDQTRKGTVAHLAPDARAVAGRHTPAAPGAVVFPRWQQDCTTSLTPMPEHVTFSSLAFNAFNYAALGAEGFLAVVRLTRQMPAWQLLYSDLDDAIETIDRLWPSVREGAALERDRAGVPDVAAAASED